MKNLFNFLLDFITTKEYKITTIIEDINGIVIFKHERFKKLTLKQVYNKYGYRYLR